MQQKRPKKKDRNKERNTGKKLNRAVDRTRNEFERNVMLMAYSQPLICNWRRWLGLADGRIGTGIFAFFKMVWIPKDMREGVRKIREQNRADIKLAKVKAKHDIEQLKEFKRISKNVAKVNKKNAE